MIYPFFCKNDLCDDYCVVKNIEMKMSEYDPDQTCNCCGQPMQRTIESMVCGYMDNKDFYGKKTK